MDIIRSKWYQRIGQEDREEMDWTNANIRRTQIYGTCSLMTRDERLSYFVFDHQLTKKIEEYIQAEPYIAMVADNIQVMVEYGIATLDGIVFTELEKLIIEDIALTQAGSGKVNNYIQVI